MVTGGPHPSPSGSAEMRSAMEEVILQVYSRNTMKERVPFLLLRMRGVNCSVGGEGSVESGALVAGRRLDGFGSGKFVKIEQKFSIGGVGCGGAQEGRRRAEKGAWATQVFSRVLTKQSALSNHPRVQQVGLMFTYYSTDGLQQHRHRRRHLHPTAPRASYMVMALGSKALKSHSSDLI